MFLSEDCPFLAYVPCKAIYYIAGLRHPYILWILVILRVRDQFFLKLAWHKSKPTHGMAMQRCKATGLVHDFTSRNYRLTEFRSNIYCCRAQYGHGGFYRGHAITRNLQREVCACANNITAHARHAYKHVQLHFSMLPLFGHWLFIDTWWKTMKNI
jgi:hypothetical protein